MKKKDIHDKVKSFLKKEGFELIESYSNGEIGLWGMDKERETEIIFRWNTFPDEETIEEFKESWKEEK